MKSQRSTPSAALLALLSGESVALDDERWVEVIALAAWERMLLRLGAALDDLGISPPDFADEAFAAAKAKAHREAVAAADLGDRLRREGRPCAFLKLAQTWPDVGHDLDLLVTAHDHGEFPILHGIALDVHRGKLGRIGEFARLADGVLHRCCEIERDGRRYVVPSVEDQVLVLAATRVYGKPRIRLSDVHFTLTATADPAFDLGRLWDLAAESGIAPGLACFLDYADQVLNALHDGSPLGEQVRASLPRGPWGDLRLREGRFVGPSARVTSYLYARLALARLRAGDLRTVSRIALAPMTVLSNRLSRPRS